MDPNPDKVLSTGSWRRLQPCNKDIRNPEGLPYEKNLNATT